MNEELAAALKIVLDLAKEAMVPHTPENQITWEEQHNAITRVTHEVTLKTEAFEAEGQGASACFSPILARFRGLPEDYKGGYRQTLQMVQESKTKEGFTDLGLGANTVLGAITLGREMSHRFPGVSEDELAFNLLHRVANQGKIATLEELVASIYVAIYEETRWQNRVKAKKQQVQKTQAAASKG
jgi:hypothetical protein